MNYNKVVVPPPSILEDSSVIVKQVEEGVYICDSVNAVLSSVFVIPFKDGSDLFTFELWLMVEMKEMTRVLQSKVADMPFTGVLLSNLPFYGIGKGIEVKAYFDLKSKEHKKPTILGTEQLGKT